MALSRMPDLGNSVLYIQLCFSILFLLFVQCESKNVAYATYKDNGIEVYEVDDVSEIPSYHLAKAVYDNQINTTGWAFLELHSSTEYDDVKQAYAAGFLEGVLTHDLIWMHWQNTVRGICDDKKDACEKVEQYINKNERWVQRMIETSANTDPYWYQVKLYLRQLEGLADGYSESVSDPAHGLSYRDMLFINMDGDLEDLFPAMGLHKEAGEGHCSALIKMLPDGSDIYVAQTTWTSYQSMLRVQKKYVLKYKTLPNTLNTIKGHTMSFSSYPGQLQSGDDFYITSAKLVTLETTIGNENANLWKFCKPVGQVMEFVRSMVANRLAGSAKSWVDIFRKYNSGTYNNQWMVVDYKKFIPGAKENLLTDFLWVIEQIPGTTEAQDMTGLLKSQEYWPSYNLPYFPNIFNLSGVPDMVEKYGDWFTYDKNPRAQIFKRDQGKIKNMDDMFALMRYNDFKHDPLSKCDCNPPFSAENAIAARNDLNKANGTYPFKALGHRSHGATDVKITNMKLADRLQFLSVSGPTHNTSRGLPPFRWSQVDFGASTPHIGHPDTWQFEPLTHQWVWGQEKIIRRERDIRSML